MNQKGFTAPIIILGIVVFIGVAGGAFYLGKNTSKLSSLPSAVNQSTPSLSAQSVQTTPFPIPDEMARCMKERQGRLGQSKYEKGYLMIGFKTASKEEAAGIIKSYGLDDFSYSSREPLTLIVKVPVGEESRWMCKLESDPNIKYAELNFIYGSPDCNKGPC